MLSIPPQKRRAVAEQWLAATIRTYPSSTGEFLLQEKDVFRNPVGAALTEGLPALLEELFGEMDPHRISQSLEGIVRIRAVQNFSPRSAVSFVLALKTILRKELAPDLDMSRELDDRVDELALVAFDLFVRCREQVYDVRLGERSRARGVLTRMGPGDERG
jgi:RsbT co-antagonist protein rsbRD N-terminal domain